MWAQRTGGLHSAKVESVRRDLGTEACDIITEHIDSIAHAIGDPKEGLAFAIEWGRELMKRLTKNLSRCMSTIEP